VCRSRDLHDVLETCRELKNINKYIEEIVRHVGYLPRTSRMSSPTGTNSRYYVTAALQVHAWPISTSILSFISHIP